MADNQLSQDNQDSLTAPTPPIQVVGAHKTNTILIAIIFILVVALVGFVAFFFGAKSKITTPVATIPAPSPTTQNNSATPTPSTKASTQSYQSDALTDFSFSYDPATWSISQLPTTTNSKLSLEAKDGGILTFTLDLPWGMGGGVSTFKTGDLQNLTTRPEFYRLKRISGGKTSYDYGNDQSVNLFSAKPDSKADALKQCQDQADGVEGMFFYSPEQCAQITSGEIIGYVSVPGFTRSFTFRPSVDLGKINSKWAGDEYVDSLGDTYVIVSVTYTGSNPTQADDIVNQLKSL